MEHDEGSYVSDLRGFSRLVIAATTGVTDIVEHMHHTIQRVPLPVGQAPEGRTRGITGLVYGAVRLVTGAVGESIDLVLAQLAPLLAEQPDSRQRVYAQGALNAVVGDYLETSHNPLVVRMRLTHEGKSLALQPEALAQAVPGATGKLVVFVHGLGMNDQWWLSLRPSYGEGLRRELGYTPLYLRYNTGRHISLNGRQLAGQLDALVAAWPVPVEELTLVGFSMGGLVSRSAVHYAKDEAGGFRHKLRHLVFIGSPHHGAPLERGGNWVDFLGGVSPYSAPIFRVGKIRSAGITDLRHGNLLDADWLGRDRFERAPDARASVPLPEDVRCHAVAGQLAPADAGGSRSRVLGDGLVPVDSALGHHADPARRLGLAEQDTRLFESVDHLGLLNHPGVYEALRGWLS